MDDCRHRGRVVSALNGWDNQVYIVECVVCRTSQGAYKNSIPKWLRVAIEDYEKAQVLNV